MKTMGRQAGLFLSLTASLWIAACGGGGGGTTTPPPSKATPTVTLTPSLSTITTAQGVTVTVAVSGSSGVPTGTVTLSSGTYTSAATTLSSGSASINVPAGALSTGTDTLTASYTPDATSSSTYNSASGIVSLTVKALIAPTVTVTPGASGIATGQTLAVTVAVSGGGSNPTPTGSVTLTSGAYTSGAITLSSGSASITIPAATLAVGTDTLTASYTPDSGSSSTYSTASGTSTVAVTALLNPTVTVTPASSSITAAQALLVTVTVGGVGSNPTPTGTVTLTSGSYTSAATALSGGIASITIPAGSLAVGSVSLVATYGGSAIYNTATASASETVTALIVPAVTVSPASNPSNVAQSLAVTVSVSGGGSNPTPTGSVTLTSGTYTSASTTLSGGGATITIPANSLATGNDTLSATYTPDTNGAINYKNSTGTGAVTVVSTTPYTLTINSAAPASGISITVSPTDNNSAGSGTTPFTRTYYSGTQVTLTAGAVDNTYSFVSWTGCTSASAGTCNVTLNANTAVTATYNMISVTSITVTPTTATIGAQQQFTATVNGTGSYTHVVTWSVSCSSCGSLSSGSISSTGLYTTPYPAPASLTITATSTQSGFTNVSGSATVTLSPPATATGPTLNVDLNTPTTPGENPHSINPFVYGMNAYFLDQASAKIANPSLIRWGGDATSRYNYTNNMTNSAADYYFENFPSEGSMFPNATGSSTFSQYVTAGDALPTAVLGTVPVLGWVSNSVQNACGFPKSQFPNQQSYSPSNCGNGVSSTGTDLLGNSTTQTNTSIPAPAPDITAGTTPAPGSSPSTLSTWANGTWSGGWVNSMVTNASFGNGASGKGVALWDLDNEPTWWDAVHRDVHPNPFTYDEVTNNGIGTALAIKTADPTALVSGPVMDNWWAYFYSKQDIENGYTKSPCYDPWSYPTDRTSHGGVPMLLYYLQKMNSYSQQYGVRLLDYLDVHAYFSPNYNGSSVGFTTAGDTPEQEARMNGTRVYWDPTYTDPNYPQPNYITDSNYDGTNCSIPLQAPQVIPMMKAWVNGTSPLGNSSYNYPGTKIAIDEYNFGGLESINGAVVQADLLGIFGRQGLDMGALWPTSAYSGQGPGNYSFAMYRNYDLANDGAVFGDTYLYATSTSSGSDAEGQLAVYGGQRTSDSAITVMVINKTYGSLTSTINLQNFTAPSGTTAQVYQYSNANLNAIQHPAAVNVTSPTGAGTTSTIGYTFPGQSITLFVVPD